MPEEQSSLLPHQIINKQSIFVVSIPLAGRRVNLSPKGHPTRSLVILDVNKVAYLDATGSGCETISQVFYASPEIMRSFCFGSIIKKDSKGFEARRANMGNDVELTGARAIVLVNIWNVQTSCGLSVPLVVQSNSGTECGEKDLVSENKFSIRDTVDTWSSRIYQNLDGLTDMRSAKRARGQWMTVGGSKAWVRGVGRQWDILLVGMLMTISVILVLHTSGLLIVERKSSSHQH
ncbi:hypothetical protein K505DRAFT_352849 [Melanomma pulvis-pyrius CBS 109.77]|uniref:Pyridoxamine phosphate oxidase family protein n=1 Tax=Melanomma pulvis-pyrius CBS 109.77 TaxID=1314802 RepID=A0A6A6WYK0_9PLEO|nr:hypothetical protein K505DRAFT_352849 [Melanomma pulvis-pyrius CBS 109.77]